MGDIIIGGEIENVFTDSFSCQEPMSTGTGKQWAGPVIRVDWKDMAR